MKPLSIERYRRPEYTGSNRCLACTLANSVLAVTVANAVFAFAIALGYRPTVAGGVAFAVLGLAAVQIWLRGYLIPGTPILTERYVPPWVLRVFGKEPFVIDGTRAESEFDAVGHLRAANVVKPSEDADPVVDDEFEMAWQTAIDELETPDAAFRDVFDMDGEVHLEETDRGLRVALEGRPFGRWVSRAALLADLGAGRVLADRCDAWRDRSTAERGQLLGQLRRYIDVCPACAGETTAQTAAAASCCRDYEVVTVSCSECGTRLFEVPVDAAQRVEAAT